MIIGSVLVIMTALFIEIEREAVSVEAEELSPTTIVPFTIFRKKSITGYCLLFR